MCIDNNNSILYIDDLQKVYDIVILSWVFFSPVFKHLHNLTQKRNVLQINGMGYSKENYDFHQFGLQDWPLQ